MRSGLNTLVENTKLLDNGAFGITKPAGVALTVLDCEFDGNVSGPMSYDINTLVALRNRGLNFGSSGDIQTIVEVIDHASIVDDGGASGHYDLAVQLPANAEFVSGKAVPTEAFKDTAGHNSLVDFEVGTAADDDRFYKTASPGDNIWNSTTTIPWGASEAQGTIKVTSATTIRCTFTTDSDVTDLISGAGAQGTMTLKITYRML